MSVVLEHRFTLVLLILTLALTPLLSVDLKAQSLSVRSLNECNDYRKNKSYYLECITQLSVQERNSSFCLNAHPYDRDDCLYKYALSTQDHLACSKIDSAKSKEWCFYEVAKETKDLTICQFLSPNFFQPECYLDMAISYSDLSICYRVTGKREADTCFGYFARINRDKTLCAQIRRPWPKRSCEEDIDNNWLDTAGGPDKSSEILSCMANHAAELRPRGYGKINAFFHEGVALDEARNLFQKRSFKEIKQPYGFDDLIPPFFWLSYLPKLGRNEAYDIRLDVVEKIKKLDAELYPGTKVVNSAEVSGSRIQVQLEGGVSEELARNIFAAIPDLHVLSVLYDQADLIFAVPKNLEAYTACTFSTDERIVSIKPYAALSEECRDTRNDRGIFIINGTVRLFEKWNGSFLIVSDDGLHYDPMNLPSALRIDGENISVQGRECREGRIGGFGLPLFLLEANGKKIEPEDV